jgi:hypothetical protein
MGGRIRVGLNHRFGCDRRYEGCCGWPAFGAEIESAEPIGKIPSVLRCAYFHRRPSSFREGKVWGQPIQPFVGRLLCTWPNEMERQLTYSGANRVRISPERHANLVFLRSSTGAQGGERLFIHPFCTFARRPKAETVGSPDSLPQL